MNKKIINIFKIIPLLIITILLLCNVKKVNASETKADFKIEYVESNKDDIDFYIDLTFTATQEINLSSIGFSLDAEFEGDAEGLPGLIYMQVKESKIEEIYDFVVNYDPNDVSYLFYIEIKKQKDANDLNLKSGESFKIGRFGIKFEKYTSDDPVEQFPDYNGKFKLCAGENTDVSCDNYGTIINYTVDSFTNNIKDIIDGNTSNPGSGEVTPPSGNISSSGGQGSTSNTYNENLITVNTYLNSKSTSKCIMIDYELNIPVGVVFNYFYILPVIYVNGSSTYETTFSINVDESTFFSTASFKISNEDVGFDTLTSSAIVYSKDSGENFDTSNEKTVFLGTLELNVKDDVNLEKLKVTLICDSNDDDGSFILDEDIKFNFSPLDITFNSTSETITYNVEFNTDGGSVIQNQTITKGEKIDKPDNPTKNGYVFDGWYKSLTDSEEFDFDTIIDSNITLYAKWNKDESSKPVSGNISSSGGQGSTSNTYNENLITVNTYLNSKSTSKCIMIDYELNIPVGVVFNYFYILPVIYVNGLLTYDTTYIINNEESSIFSSISFNVLNEDTGFSSINPVIVYSKDSGENFDTSNEKTVFLGTLVLNVKDDVNLEKLKVTLICDIANIENEYCDTSYVEDDQYQHYEFNFSPLDITFNSLASTISYKITYYLSSNILYTTRLVTKGDNIIKPADPVKKGYKFKNWVRSLTTNEVFDFESELTNDISLYALWEEDEETLNPTKYKVTFNTTGTIVSSLTTNYIEKEPITEKDGYLFIGWYDNSLFSGDIIIFPLNVDKNMTLYAKFILSDIISDDIDKTKPSFISKLTKECDKDGYFKIQYYIYNPTQIEINRISISLTTDDYCDVYGFISSTTYNFNFDSDLIYLDTIKTTNNLIYLGEVTYKVKNTTPLNQEMSLNISDNTLTNIKDLIITVTSIKTFKIELMLDNKVYKTLHTFEINGTEEELIAPSKEGYTFKGWYTNSLCTKAYLCSFPYNVTKDIKLYGAYEANDVSYLKYEVIDNTSQILKLKVSLMNPSLTKLIRIDLTFEVSFGFVIGYDYSSCSDYKYYEYENGGICAYNKSKTSYCDAEEINLGIIYVLNGTNDQTGYIVADESYTLLDINDEFQDLKCEQFDLTSNIITESNSNTDIKEITVTVDDVKYNAISNKNNEYTFGKFDSSFDEAFINVETLNENSLIRIDNSSDVLNISSYKVNMFNSSQTYEITITASDGTQEEYKVIINKYTELESKAEIIFELGNTNTIDSYYQGDININIYLNNANYKVGKLCIVVCYDEELFEYNNKYQIKCSDYNMSNTEVYDDYLYFELFNDSGVLNSNKYLLLTVSFKLKETLEHKEYNNIIFSGTLEDDIKCELYNPANTIKDITIIDLNLNIVKGISPYLSKFIIKDNNDVVIFTARQEDLIINNNVIEISIANGYSNINYLVDADTLTTIYKDSLTVNKNTDYIYTFVENENQLELIFTTSVMGYESNAKITFKITKEAKSDANIIFELDNNNSLDIYSKEEIKINIYISNANYYINKILIDFSYDNTIFNYYNYSIESLFELVNIEDKQTYVNIEIKKDSGVFNLEKYKIASISFKLKENIISKDYDITFTSTNYEIYNLDDENPTVNVTGCNFIITAGNSPYLTQFYIKNNNDLIIYNANVDDLIINNNEININIDNEYDTIGFFVNAGSLVTIYKDDVVVNKLTKYELNLEIDVKITLIFVTRVENSDASATIKFNITRNKTESIPSILKLITGTCFEFKSFVEIDFGFYKENVIQTTEHTIYDPNTRCILANVLSGLTIKEFISQFVQYDFYLQNKCDFKVYDSTGYEIEKTEYESSFNLVSTSYQLELYINDVLTDKIYVSVLGDTSSDGEVDSLDIVSIVSYINLTSTFTEEIIISMDADKNGIIDLDDVNLWIKHYNSIENVFDGMNIVNRNEEESTISLLNTKLEVLDVVNETNDNLDNNEECKINNYKIIYYDIHRKNKILFLEKKENGDAL